MDVDARVAVAERLLASRPHQPRLPHARSASSARSRCWSSRRPSPSRSRRPQRGRSIVRLRRRCSPTRAAARALPRRRRRAAARSLPDPELSAPPLDLGRSPVGLRRATRGRRRPQADAVGDACYDVASSRSCRRRAPSPKRSRAGDVRAPRAVGARRRARRRSRVARPRHPADRASSARRCVCGPLTPCSSPLGRSRLARRSPTALVALLGVVVLLGRVTRRSQPAAGRGDGPARAAGKRERSRVRSRCPARPLPGARPSTAGRSSRPRSAPPSTRRGARRAGRAERLVHEESSDAVRALIRRGRDGRERRGRARPDRGRRLGRDRASAAHRPTTPARSRSPPPPAGSPPRTTGCSAISRRRPRRRCG